MYHLVCWQSWLVTAILIEFLSLSLSINKSSDIFRSKAPSKMSSLLDKIPFVPKLTKFLVCLDLYQGVRYTSMVLMVLWVIYAIVAFFKLALSGAIWSLIWYVISLSIFSLTEIFLSSGAWPTSPLTEPWSGACRRTTGSTCCPLSTSPSSMSSSGSSAGSSTLRH